MTLKERLELDEAPIEEGSPYPGSKSNLSLVESHSGLTSYQLKQLYGISRAQYEEMVRRQRGCCLICKEPKKLYVDHNHETGVVRGLLCNNCNSGLGMFKDNIRNLANAIVYLEDNGYGY